MERQVATSSKLQELRKWSLRIVYNDFEPPIHSLVEKSGQESLLSNKLKYFILDGFKSVNKLNVGCLHDMFVLKEVPNVMRTPRLEQPIGRTTTYGLLTFSYLGARLWNHFVSNFSDTSCTDISELRTFLEGWEGTKLDPSYRNNV